ncbi:hypothetical protein D9757_004108 [Collybiopsis confluens]|uniref:Uncharacterized protein n=1 Tax=Collybiopsis confluens TaxID=2823264 RepID=A0A8H5MCN6_9AGAR|nr:hypothetical protein D9757_004108 [Collybiopsis confluens]
MSAAAILKGDESPLGTKAKDVEIDSVNSSQSEATQSVDTNPSDNPSQNTDEPDNDKHDLEDTAGDWTSDQEPDRPEQHPRGGIKRPVSGANKPRPK